MGKKISNVFEIVKDKADEIGLKAEFIIAIEPKGVIFEFENDDEDAKIHFFRFRLSEYYILNFEVGSITIEEEELAEFIVRLAKRKLYL